MSDGDEGIPELTESERIRIQAIESDFTAMGDALRNGTATPEDVEGAFARFMSLDIDPDKHRNALHIPADAGPHATAIETILRRIPDGWGRWISVDPGWYPLVIATDQRLVEIDAEYVVHQIKEKFGTLRYYYWPSSEDASPELLDAMDTITDDAERASAITCERCGEPGVLQRTRFWAKTLCHACADPLGYAPVLPQDLV
ncbi:hypothetical protein [Mycolicibacterium fluoranthenivorans]|uniref:Uncharacterized protein n=1 Tax=Mycolicibacterium fluoranthenivorans TaxID=258505 RepID=A0A7X5ZFI6_9MYCO|nr:hypothetical protein [Mycolicibacterium fluoranthenivorans]MCV7355341.1 hypothetical protein [Mycolicibacterium fluoranthenivorans]NIH98276.1 hypothetical protein [Mycolicibacterium fluoranthenivorans]